MRREQFRAQAIVDLIARHRAVTMSEMKAAVGTSVDMTIYRKLRELSHITSYSHRGAFFSLTDVAEFDDRGLWECRGARFSHFGSLLDTVEHFVHAADRGKFASELVEDLGVEVKEALLTLFRAGRICRDDLMSRFLYCSAEAVRRRQQVLARRFHPEHEPFGRVVGESVAASDEVNAAIVLFLSTLDEKRRRLFAGLESLRVGRGGDRRIADITGMDVHTIAKGRQELVEGKLALERIRRPGGGRKSVKKKRLR